MPSPQFPRPSNSPTADAAERWLRQIAPLLDAVERYLSPNSVERPGPGDGPPHPDADAAALAEHARVRASLPPDRRAARFSSLTACPASRARGGAIRSCRHTHVELLIEVERGSGPGGPRYAVRIVNVDLPRWRHRDALIAPAPTWPDRGEAAAAGLRLARERWGDVAVVHGTPVPDRAEPAMDGGCA